MFVPPDKLIAAAAQVIRNHLIPSLGDKHARSRAWALVDILGNLEQRVELKGSPLEAEAASALEALRRVVDPLRQSGEQQAADEIEERCRVTERLTDPVERARAARDAIVHVLRRVAGMPATVSDCVLAELDRHLAEQALRDAMSVRPTPLAEIAQG